MELLEYAERAWRGELSEKTMRPQLLAPALARFDEQGLAFVSAFANVLAVSTREGLVLLDTSSILHAQRVHELLRAWSALPVHTAVYTHGHVDHVFGLGPFEAEPRADGGRLTVLAHRAVPERFARYRLTQGYNARINQRQFRLPAPLFPTAFREPDVLCDDAYTLRVGGRTIELRHARGETDDHLWAYVPDARALYTGDLFIWAAPNCGNPQKVQRYPREWAAALRAMQACEAERLFPGHGPPIVGAARVRRALDETASLLETLVEQTLALMNAGATLDEVLRRVKVPEALLARPYLRATYDDPRFVVRNLWRLYGGWWDGNPARLQPPRDRELALRLCALAGGAARVADEALAALREERVEVAGTLAQHALDAAPDDPAVRAAYALVFERRAELEPSLMAQSIYLAAARRARR